MAKKEAYKVKPMTEEKRNIIAGLIHEYDIQSANDIQETLKVKSQDTVDKKLNEWNETWFGNNQKIEVKKSAGDVPEFLRKK